MLELKRPLVFLDVETTGLHPQIDRVIQIGLLKIYSMEKITEWETLINPGIVIPPEVIRIHSITDEMVAKAPRFADIAPQLAGGLMGCDLGGYNVRFDISFLKKEFERVGGKDILSGAKIVDSSRIYHQRERRTLVAAVKRYLGEELPDAHNALVDARASWRVFLAQLEEYPDLPRDVEELHKVYFESPAQGHLDAEGKLAWRYGEATVNFGKFAAVSLKNVDRKYLLWMLSGDFTDSVKDVIRKALEGNFPKREEL